MRYDERGRMPYFVIDYPSGMYGGDCARSSSLLYLILPLAPALFVFLYHSAHSRAMRSHFSVHK